VSDHERPPPGVHPAAWSRWLERRGQPIPADLLTGPPVRGEPDRGGRPEPGPDGRPTEGRAAPDEAAPARLDVLRVRLEAARQTPPPTGEISVRLDDLAALFARAERLASALDRYGRHADGCRRAADAAAACDCGLAAALQGE
jgi:hypothetical protein